MFETALEAWKRYLTQVSEAWPEADPRHSLGGEVSNRLRHLDLVIRLLEGAIRDVTPEEGETRRNIAWMRANRERLTRGEISGEEYMAGFIRTYRPPQEIMDGWDSVTLYTEMFYFVAWRMVEVLNRRGPYRFPDLGNIKATAITVVRNNLIEHPEHVKDAPNFTLGLVVLSSGPVLRSHGAVARGATGRMEPLAESKDRGLYVAAEELRDELHHEFDAAIATTQQPA